MLNAIKKGAEEPNFIELLRQKDQRIHTLEADLLTLKEQLSWLQKQVFGVRSERLVDLHDQPLLPGFDPKTQDAEPEQEEVHFKRRKKKKNKGKDTISYPDNLPVKRIALDIPEEEKFCSETGAPLVQIGFEISRKLARKPEQFYIREYARPKYASKAVPELGIKVAPLPDAIIDRCPADERPAGLYPDRQIYRSSAALPFGRNPEACGYPHQSPDPFKVGSHLGGGLVPSL